MKKTVDTLRLEKSNKLFHENKVDFDENLLKKLRIFILKYYGSFFTREHFLEVKFQVKSYLNQL